MKIKISVLLLFLNLAGLRAATITWTNTAGGSWQTAANWQPNQVPGAADTALITTAGTYTITLANNVTVNNFTLGAASGLQTVSIASHTLKATTLGAVAINGELLMTGGGLEGNISVATGGLLRFSGGAQKSMYSTTLQNAGTVQWQGGSLSLGNTPTTIVTNTGLWEISSDASMNLGIGGPTARFVNAGTGIVRKLTGVGTTIFGSLQFINAGLVEAQQGVINFSNMEGSIFGGVFTAASGATIQLSNGTYTENGAVFNGSGARTMSGGTLTLVNDIMAGLSLNGGTVKVLATFQAAGAITNLTINGARLTGTNEVAGNLTVADGGINGALTVRLGGTLTLTSGAQKDLTQLTLNNNGTVKWQGGGISLGNTPTTLITNSALWEINSDASMSLAVGGPVPRFVNAASGTFRKIGGTGTTSLGSFQFINAGLVDVEQGVLSFSNMDGAILGGTFTADPGATIQFASGSYTENGAVFNGGGTLRMNGGTLTLVNNIMPGLTLGGGNIQIGAGGTFQSSGAITNLTISGSRLIGNNEVAGNLTLVDGGITGSLTVRPGGTFTISSAAQKDLTQLTLNNNGTVKWNGGTLSLGNTPTTLITNSALWEINSDATMTLGVGGPVPRFVNKASGIVRKIGGVGTTSINNIQVVNEGAFEVQNGTLSIGSSENAILGGTFSADALTAFYLASGTYTENGAAFSGAGALRMNGGTLTLVSNIMTGLSLNGGVVRVQSTFQAAGAITNLTLNGAELAGTNEVAGSMFVADGGINGHLTVRPTGTLTITTGAQKDLTQLTLINNGTVRWNGGTLSFGNTPSTIVTNTGLWEINSDATLTLGVGGPVPRFVNTSTGIVRKIAGVGQTSFNNIQFVNAGLVEAQQGVISFGSMENAILGGTFTALPGAVIQLSSGTYTENGAVFNGGGTLRMTGGTLTLVNNIMPGLLLAGGNVNITGTFQASGAITNLTVSGGELTGVNQVAGNLTIQDGGISGNLTVLSGGTLTITTGAQKDFTQLTLINNGTVKWNGGTLSFGNTPTTVVTNTGLWEINSDATMTLGVGGPIPRFVNTATGIVRKIGGVGQTSFNNILVINAGLFEALSGTISFGSMENAILSGTFTAAPGALIQLSSGTYTEGGAVFNGGGTLRMTGGTLTLVNDIMNGLLLNGGVVRIQPTFQAAGAITNLTLTGAELTGTNEIAGGMTIADGGVSGVLTVRSGGTLTFSSGAQKDLTQLTLVNNGTVKWNGGTLSLGNTPTTLMTNTGLWEINSDASMNLGVGGPVPRFVNATTGILRKIGGSGTTTIANLQFVNQGAVEALLGTISFGSMENAMLGGTFNASAGAVIQFSNGTYTENGGAVTGGTVRMSGGTLSLVTNNVTGLALIGGNIKVGANYQAAGVITNLVLDGATLVETNEISGLLTVNSGGIAGRITVGPTGTLILATSAQKDLTRLTLINNGAVRWLGGTLSLGNTPTTLITNNSVWEISGDNSMHLGVGGPDPVFSNAGTFRKKTATGTTTLSSFTFINTSAGVIEAESGTIRFPNNQPFSTGTLRLTGGRIESQGNLVVSGGTLEGTGQFGGSQFTGGTISPGLLTGAGKITFTSGLRLNSATTLRINALNATPATGYDQLAVTGTIDLAGAFLDLGNIATLPVGTKLTFIENDLTDVATNTFNGFPEGSLFTHGLQLFRIRYTSAGNDVALVRDDGGVRLTTLTLLSDDTYRLTGLGTNNGNYTISATTNFTSWVDLGTVQADSGGVFQIIDTNAALYRFRFYRSFGPGVSQ